jgi:hypothetical protein
MIYFKIKKKRASGLEGNIDKNTLLFPKVMRE